MYTENIENDLEKNYRLNLKNSNRIVVKVGTSTLTFENGKLNIQKIQKICQVLTHLMNSGKEIILVSSGAIGVGKGILSLARKPKNIKEKQALAAIGQLKLMHIYNKFFQEFHQVIGQILLTIDIFNSTTGLKNVTNTFNKLLDMKVIPIVNENDSIAVDEIKFGDNDTLSAIVAQIVHADLLILLSDIDGLYDKNPKTSTDYQFISFIDTITPEIYSFADDTNSLHGTGGMITKLSAAKIATSSNIDMIITNGENPETILEILEGKTIGTLFAGKKHL